MLRFQWPSFLRVENMRHSIVWTARFAIVIGGVLSAPGIADAATFPAPLLGKSVTVNWTEIRQVKFEDNGEIGLRSRGASLQVYISTAGRAFTKESVRTVRSGSQSGTARGGTSFQEERAPGDPASSLGRSNDVVHMEGGALAVDRNMREGARRIAVTFDAGYTSCNARVILGREGGTGALRGRNPVNGRSFEIVSVNIATPSCSVASGNVFGGE
jgi:hypothetical protein